MDGSPDEVKERSKQFPYRLLDGVVVNNNKRRPKCPVPPFFARPPKTLKNHRATRQTNYLQACFVLFFSYLSFRVLLFLCHRMFLGGYYQKGKGTHTHARDMHLLRDTEAKDGETHSANNTGRQQSKRANN